MQIGSVRLRAIEKEEYEGPVYNLETESEHYVVEGVIVHNCPHNWSVKPEKVAPDQCRHLWMGG